MLYYRSMEFLKILLTLSVMVTPTLIISSCLAPLVYENSNIYASDIYIDEFNSFNSEMWDKEESFYGYSAIRKENVSISNGNLVLKIPQNTTDGGGIFSLKRFKNGNFSIAFNNPSSNTILELQLYDSQNTFKGKILTYFSLEYNTNIIEAMIESPITNVETSNFISNINFMMISFSYQTLNFIYNYNNTTLLSFSDSRIPDSFFVKILLYLRNYNIENYDRNSYIDFFKYERIY